MTTHRAPARESQNQVPAGAAQACGEAAPSQEAGQLTHTLGRADFDLITAWIAPGDRVLDLGCGDGTLLKHLIETRGVHGWGVEMAGELVSLVAQVGFDLEFDAETEGEG